MEKNIEHLSITKILDRNIQRKYEYYFAGELRGRMYNITLLSIMRGEYWPIVEF